jgi:hypothetical protein
LSDFFGGFVGAGASGGVIGVVDSGVVVGVEVGVVVDVGGEFAESITTLSE